MRFNLSLLTLTLALSASFGAVAQQGAPKLAQKSTYKVGFAQTESNNPWRIAQTKSLAVDDRPADPRGPRDGVDRHRVEAGLRDQRLGGVEQLLAPRLGSHSCDGCHAQLCYIPVT